MQISISFDGRRPHTPPLSLGLYHQGGTGTAIAAAEEASEEGWRGNGFHLIIPPSSRFPNLNKDILAEIIQRLLTNSNSLPYWNQKKLLQDTSCFPAPQRLTAYKFEYKYTEYPSNYHTGGRDSLNVDFRKHLVRVHDYQWLADDGLKMEGRLGGLGWRLE